MPTNEAAVLSPGARRRALGLGLINAALWSAGNGLTTGPLVYYLALDLGAKGTALGLLLAAPTLSGLLRLFAPAVIRSAGSAKRACLSTYLISYSLLLLLPAVGVLPRWWSRPRTLALMIGLLCVHQLLEFIGTVALWSWLADLVPPRIRGRYFARRQMWQLTVLIPTMLISGVFVDHWRTARASEPEALLWGYSLANGLGVVLLIASLLPLVAMPMTRDTRSMDSAIDWRAMAAPLADRTFRRLLGFRIWLSLANGITQSVQSVYPKNVLKLSVGDLQVMKTTMLFGQIGVARWVGRASDRYGNRPVLMIGQACVAASLAFFLVARPEPRVAAWLVLGAWVLWSAYAVHNICLPNLVLKLAPPQNRPAYIAAHDALSSLAHATATVGGGMLFDWLKLLDGVSESVGPLWDAFAKLLWLGLVLRLLAIPLMALVPEPGARSWRSIFGRSADDASAPGRIA